MIYGRIKRETEKAVLMSVAPQIHGHEQDLIGDVWFPKSVCNILERALGPLDAIQAPAWLVRARQAA